MVLSPGQHPPARQRSGSDPRILHQTRHRLQNGQVLPGTAPRARRILKIDSHF